MAKSKSKYVFASLFDTTQSNKLFQSKVKFCTLHCWNERFEIESFPFWYVQKLLQTKILIKIYWCVDFLEESFQLNKLKVWIDKKYNFIDIITVVNFVPKLSFKVLKSTLQVVFWLFKFNFVEVLFNFLIFFNY